MKRIAIPVLIVAALVGGALFLVFNVFGGSDVATTTPAAPQPLQSSALPEPGPTVSTPVPSTTASAEETASDASVASDKAVEVATQWINLFANASSANMADQRTWAELAKPLMTDDYSAYIDSSGAVDSPEVFDAAHQFNLYQRPNTTCVPLIDEGAETDGNNLLVDCSFFSTTVDAQGKDFDITQITSTTWPYDGSYVNQGTFGMQRGDDGIWRVANILWG